MDFIQARFNMVEQQIRPWDVLDFDLLDVLSELPRERFVAPEHHGYAYADIALPLPNGSRMLEPKIVARLVQGLQLNKTDTVVEVGTGSGYATAVLAALADKVVSIDTDAVQQQRAAAVLADLGIGNVEFRVADGLQGVDVPYTAVYIGGACTQIPETLKNPLPQGGRMVAVIGAEPVMRAKLVEKTDQGFSEKMLFDTLIPLLDSSVDRPWGKFRF